jgi:SAM-dependent methyltransferase
MTATAEIQALKEAHRRTWASGDYPRVAERVTKVGERIVERAGVRPGSQVLDVAAGTGNASIPAAGADAHVVATDLTPELFRAGRSRALDAGSRSSGSPRTPRISPSAMTCSTTCSRAWECNSSRGMRSSRANSSGSAAREG